MKISPAGKADAKKNIIFTNPFARARYDTRSIFKRSLKGLNSEFFFSEASCLTKAEETSLPYYLPIAGGRIIGFIPFPRVLALCETQSVLYRIWTRVAVSISYDDNHYTTGTSMQKKNIQPRIEFGFRRYIMLISGKNKKKKKTSRNQSPHQKSHQRNQYLGSPLWKIQETILKMHQKGT